MVSTTVSCVQGFLDRKDTRRIQKLPRSTEETLPRTQHTFEPLAWHWSHWPGRLVNRVRGKCLFRGENDNPRDPCGVQGVQGYLAHEKLPPPPRANTGP